MHPVVVLIPVAAALVLGPRVWVMRVLQQHNRKEQEGFLTGGEIARELLARHGLHRVKVESTDVGDHYDPKTKTVRLTRDKHARKTLTAITTAAHEVAHALQDASNYGPFVWRTHLVKLAQTTGQAGSVILVAVPATAILTGHRVPPLLIGAVALAMLGTGLAAQLAALPTELDASFGRAMPLLRDGYIDEKQSEAAKEILVASSLTYVASSLLAVLNIWPWLGSWGPVRFTEQRPLNVIPRPKDGIAGTARRAKRSPHFYTVKRRSRNGHDAGVLETLVRSVGKPMIRTWFRLRSNY